MKARSTALVALLLCASSGCFTRAYRPDPGPYDRVPEEVHGELVQARASFEAGELAGARARLAAALSRLPRCLPVAVFQQEVELLLLEKGGAVEGLSAPGEEEARIALAELYRTRADAEPTPASEVLAARLETDSESALERLGTALELDPDCIWAHYGVAHWNARLRRFPKARAELKAAFRLDGGHLPSMRLHAWLLANAGETAEARDCLERWLARTEDDPLTDAQARAEARVDLAALAVLLDDPEEALSILEQVDRGALAEPARAELVAGAAFEDSGEDVLAMSAARRAHNLDPGELLSLVHQALLFGAQGNPLQERAAWRWVLDELERRRTEGARSPGSSDEGVSLDLQELLIQLQARARFERLDRELGSETSLP